MTANKDTKIIIVGHQRSGKSRVANLMSAILDCTYNDSSHAMLDVIETHLALSYGLEYLTAFHMLDDKYNHREKWAEAIVGFCKDNGPTAVAQRIYKSQGHRIYVGPRKREEYLAIREEYKPLAIWIDRRTDSTPEMELTAGDCDIVLDNTGVWSQTVTRSLSGIRRYNLDGSHETGR